MRRRLAVALPPLVFAILVLALCWPVVFGGRCFSWDALWQYWGDIGVQIHAVQNGELPLWDPYDRLGYPFFADPQPGTLYPFTWPLVALGVAVGATWWLVAIKVMFHLWLFGLGMYVWLRQRDLPRAVCYAAGAFCILSYPITHGIFSALNWGIAWAPWLLLCIEAWALRPDVPRAARLALALGMTWLAGAPASFWYAVLIAAPIGAWTLVGAWRAAGDRRRFVRAAVPSAALAVGLFAIMVAGQMLAASALVPHTVRATRDLGFITESVLIGDNLFGIVVPRLPGLEMYYGMVGIFAALVAVTVRPSGRAYLLAAIAAGGLLLALGSAGGFLPSVASLLPPAGLFRRAHRYVLVTMVPFAALAAEGLALLSRLDDAAVRRRASRLLLALGGVGAMIFVPAVATLVRGKIRDAFALGIGAWAIAALLLRQIAVSSGRARGAWLAAAALFFCVEVYAGRQPQIDSNFWPAPTTPHDGELAALPDVPLGARIYDRDHLKYRPGARLGIRDLGGYEGDPLALRRYVRFMAQVAADAHVIGHANVGTVVGHGGAKLPADFRLVRPEMWAPPRVAPAVSWYGAAQIVADDEAALRALRAIPPGGGAVLERPTLTGDEIAALAGPAPPAPVAGRLVDFALDHLSAEVDAPAAGVVVIAEAYHPGWRATVDGQPAKVVPANGAFRGVLVGPGRHRIEMRYSGGATPMLMAASLAAMLAAVVLSLWRGARTASR